MEIFKLFGSIFVNTDAAEKSLQKIEKAAEKVGKGIAAVGKKAAEIGGKLTQTVTAGVSALGIVSAKSAMTFEDAMAKVSTIADESEMSMDEMRRAILDLSDQTGISAAAIAEDVYNAISAGQKTADAVNFVTNSTKLAKAGFAETGQSLDILTTILNAYGMEAGEVTRVSDILIQTQNLGKTTVADLSSSMGKVIPTAKSYGVSLEQVATAYTITTAKGIATAESTTYINSMLNELGKSGTTVSDTLRDRTGKSFAELMEEGYSLGDCLAIIDTAAKEQNLSFNDMWGSAEAAKAGVTLLGDSVDIFNARLTEMNNVTGSTDTAFEKLETNSFKLQKIINEAKNVLIDLGGTIIEMLVPYLEKASEKVHQFAEWFKGLDDNTKEVIVKIGLLAAAVGPLLGILGKVVSVTGNVIAVGSKLAGGISGLIKIGGGLISGASKVLGSFGGITTFIKATLIPAISGISAPVLAVTAVVGGLIAAGVALYQNWDTVKEWAGKAWGAIKDTIGGAIDGIKGFFGGLVDKAAEMKDKVANKFHELKEAAVDKFSELKDKVSDKVSSLKETAVNKFTELKESAAEKITALKEAAVDKFTELKEKVSEKVTVLKEAAVSRFTELKEKVSEKITSLKEAAVNKFTELKEKAFEKITSLKDMAVSKFTELKEKASDKITALKEAAVNKFTELKEKAGDKISSLKESTVEALLSIRDKGIDGFEKLKSGALDVFGKMSSGIKDKMEGVKSFVSGAVDKIKSFFDFEWKLPSIKLPHFSISGSFSLSPPSIPKIGVDWYRNGGVMMDPTVFGRNPENGNVMAGGEAGPEAIAPIEILKKYIRDAVSDRDESIYDVLNAILTLLQEILPGLKGRNLYLDTGVLVGELAGPLNDRLGHVAHMRERWN